MAIFVTRDPRSLVPSGSIEERLAGGGGRAIIPGTGAWEKAEASRKAVAAQAAARVQAEAQAKAELERRRLESLERARQTRALSLQKTKEISAIERRRGMSVDEVRRVEAERRVIQKVPIKRDPFKAKAKRFGVSLVTPSIAPKDIRKLPEKERGLAGAKSIFLEGLEGL